MVDIFVQTQFIVQISDFFPYLSAKQNRRAMVLTEMTQCNDSIHVFSEYFNNIIKEKFSKFVQNED